MQGGWALPSPAAGLPGVGFGSADAEDPDGEEDGDKGDDVMTLKGERAEGGAGAEEGQGWKRGRGGGRREGGGVAGSQLLIEYIAVYCKLL